MNPEDFKCTVCITWLDDPRTLPCGHTYCINCILILSIDAKERRLKPACPLCRKTFEPTNGDVQQMPVNAVVRDGAARLKAAVESGVEAELPPLEGLLDECPLRVGSLLEFYCPSCPENPFKCFECASEHAQAMPIHELISGDEGKEKLIEEIEKLAGVVQEKKEKASKALKEIQEKMDKVDTQCEGIEKEIDTKFDSYLSQIEKLEIASRKKLRELYQESMQPLEQDEELCQQLKSDIQALLEKHSTSSEQDKPAIEQQLKQLISTSLTPLPKHRSVRVSIPETLRLDLDEPSSLPSPSPSLETQAQEWVSFADQHPPTPVISSIGEGIDLGTALPIPSNSSHIRIHATPGESSFVIAQGTPISLHRADLTIESSKAKSLTTEAIPIRDPINTSHTSLSTTPHQLILATLLTKTPPQITKSQFITRNASQTSDDGAQTPSEITGDAIGLLANQSPCVDIAVDWAGDVYSAHTAPGSLQKYTSHSTDKDSLITQWTVSDPDQTRVWCAMLCDGDRLLVLTHAALPPHKLTLLVWSLSGILVESLDLSLDEDESTGSGDAPQRLALLLTGSRGFGVVHPQRGKVFFFAKDAAPCGVVAKAGVVAAAFVGARLVVACADSGSLRVHAY